MMAWSHTGKKEETMKTDLERANDDISSTSIERLAYLFKTIKAEGYAAGIEFAYFFYKATKKGAIGKPYLGRTMRKEAAK